MAANIYLERKDKCRQTLLLRRQIDLEVKPRWAEKWPNFLKENLFSRESGRSLGFQGEGRPPSSRGMGSSSATTTRVPTASLKASFKQASFAAFLPAQTHRPRLHLRTSRLGSQLRHTFTPTQLSRPPPAGGGEEKEEEAAAKEKDNGGRRERFSPPLS